MRKTFGILTHKVVLTKFATRVLLTVHEIRLRSAFLIKTDIFDIALILTSVVVIRLHTLHVNIFHSLRRFIFTILYSVLEIVVQSYGRNHQINLLFCYENLSNFLSNS